MSDSKVGRTIRKVLEENGLDIGEVSDGYHTFNELYAHRIALFKLVLKMFHLQNKTVWKSRFHSDGSFIKDWFIAGLYIKPGKQITYHLPISEWDDLLIPIYQKAPPFDGHTSDDVLKRLRGIFYAL